MRIWFGQLETNYEYIYNLIVIGVGSKLFSVNECSLNTLICCPQIWGRREIPLNISGSLRTCLCAR
jgi:hypothetical protein